MYGQGEMMGVAASYTMPRPVRWVAAFLAGSIVGLALRVTGFFTGVVLLKLGGHALGAMVPLLPFLDPVYTHAAERSLVDLHLQGLAVVGPFGDWLNAWLPSLFAPASRAHWA